MMQRIRLSVALLLLAAPALGAQQNIAAEVGVFGQFSKYDNFTGLTNGIGAGARLGVYLLRNFGLEYEGDFTKTKSSRLGDLTALNNRIDGILYVPVSDRLRLLVGGGWTGTQYHSDTTKNQFDSGGNAVLGFKYCMGETWAWRTDVNADFKDPSDQTTSGQRTRTYNFRVGFSRFLGGHGTKSPCYQAPPPAPPPVVVPAPAPAPEPMPPAPVTQPAPAAVPVPTPVQAPPPAPARRELLVLRGAVFAFDKSSLTAWAKDTLQGAVATLKAHPDAQVEVQGHTDWVGSDKYNQALSERRANSVKAYLVTQGIAASRITTKGFGKSQPIADNATAKGRAENRRVVIIEIP
jgi:OmpA-OmpF porin, OOP family